MSCCNGLETSGRRTSHLQESPSLAFSKKWSPLNCFDLEAGSLYTLRPVIFKGSDQKERRQQRSLRNHLSRTQTIGKPNLAESVIMSETLLRGKGYQLHCEQLTPQAINIINRRRTEGILHPRPQTCVQGEDFTTCVNCMSKTCNVIGSLTKQEATVHIHGKPDVAGGPVLVYV